MLMHYPFTFLLLFKKDFIYLLGGGGRSRLLTEQGAQHEAGSQDPEIMIWAEGRRLTDWATQVLLKVSNFYATVKPKWKFVFRIRGINGMSPNIWKMLALLHLCQLFSDTFIKLSKVSVNMLRMVELYCVGYLSLKSVIDLSVWSWQKSTKSPLSWALGWLSWLSICLWLRSWSQDPGIQPHIEFPPQWGVCFFLFPLPFFPTQVCSLSLSLSSSLSFSLQ